LAYDWPLLPWSGTLALTALLAYAWLAPPANATAPVPTAWPRPRTALLAGLAALTAVAGLVDARTGGFGWPTAVAQPAVDPLWRAVEGLLLLTASVSLAVAVVLTAGRPRSRRALVAAVAGVGLVAFLAALPVWDLYADRPPWRAAPDPLDLAVAALPLIAAATLAAVAAGAAWAGRHRSRAAAAGLAALSGLALLAVTGVVADARFHRLVPYRSEEAPLLRAEIFLVEPNTVAPSMEVPARAVLPGTAEPETVRPSLWPDDVWTAEFQFPSGLLVALWLVGVLAAVAAVLAAEDPADRLPA
jgi:hypothetical protein